MKLSEAQRIVSDPAFQLKLGYGELDISTEALNELMEYSNIAATYNSDISESEFFVSLLKQIIKEKKLNG